MSLCRIIIFGFGLLWILALGILAIGTFGLFGQEQDPLSGVFVVLLGTPWNSFLDGVPEGLRTWLAILTPLVNLAILAAICRAISARSTRTR